MKSASLKTIYYIAASVVVSCAIFAYLLTIVRPEEIVRAITRASLPGILAYMAVSLLSTIFRNMRYLMLTRVTNTDIRISDTAMFLVTLVRNLFSDLIPARIGSLIYIVILKARFGFPVEIGTSVWAICFVLDMAVMVPLMLLGATIVGAGKLGVSLNILCIISSAFFAITVLALAYLPQVMRGSGKFVARLCRRSKRARTAQEKLELTAQQIGVIYQHGVFWRAVALSFLIRALKYGCIAFLLYAILHPIDPQKYTLRAIGYWPVFVGASLAELAASTPLSGIAGFGLYEGVWAGAFYLLGYPRELAVLSGISAHVITQVFGYSLGAIAIMLLLTPLRGRRGRGMTH
ncbi:MAG: lysylphosphatidylglycerol synthase transmembrane domain-containing protein [Candidatus Aureabacteria bacterium]|nr:lysylphosphatidylglycerol synthase transmembrane domain-containing protein [Candidatus Auribacterota bacterium]